LIEIKKVNSQESFRIMQKSSPDSFKIVTKITNPQNSWKLFDTFLNPRSMEFKLFYQTYIIIILLLNFMRWKFFISRLLRNAIIFFIDFPFPHSILLCRFFFWFYLKKVYWGKSWVGWFLICWWNLALGLLSKLFFIKFPTHSILHKKILKFSHSTKSSVGKANKIILTEFFLEYLLLDGTKFLFNLLIFFSYFYINSAFVLFIKIFLSHYPLQYSFIIKFLFQITFSNHFFTRNHEIELNFIFINVWKNDEKNSVKFTIF
jgi:hypothetical protein